MKKSGWKQKLTKKELRHLQETIDGPPTLRGFRLNRAAHHKMKAENGREPCFECRFIAVKLGIEE